MNKELIEKLSTIREDLLAFQAQVTDVKKLADLVKQKAPKTTMWRNYQELAPYMTLDQEERVIWAFAFESQAEFYLERGNDFLTGTVTKMVPLMLADLDDIAENLNKGNSGTAKIGSESGS